MRQDAVSSAVLQITLFNAEISQLVTDPHAIVRAHCERAFEHVRRLIVVGRRSASSGRMPTLAEPACEALGATALLSHGIWTFKANSAGDVPISFIRNRLTSSAQPAQRMGWC